MSYKCKIASDTLNIFKSLIVSLIQNKGNIFFIPRKPTQSELARKSARYKAIPFVNKNINKRTNL